ncbi:hypothetical protein GA0070624_0833 [Micromonospora rhizosphaerae]|uniref:WD40-like Beta Propeller Repeat n=1 Tax=Micromonospora rhizosphaerae TaxID=568872 RepID=A0A1C6RFG8_9ACTN|nr:hypothetical protein [Micromonospora rhizosphaerae]SCL15823.1 hypothetical protein GA0070624_0833 [Micromonospora rhizosphaerae]
MSRQAEDALRAAVRDLANGARTAPELAGRALRRGRRLRRWRRAVATGSALAALGLLAGPYVWLRHDPPLQTTTWAPPPAAPTASTPAAASTPSVATAPRGDWTRAILELPGGWVITGATSTGGPAAQGYALDRERGRYVATARRYEEVWAAPRGGVAVVVDYERRGEVGLLDLGTGAVRWVRVGSYIMTPHWSPDGRRVALTVLDKDTGGFSLGVLTAATGGYRTFPVDPTQYYCTDYCFFTWSRDGREVVFQQTDRNAPRSESIRHPRRGVQLFSADNGRPTRFVPVPGDPAGPWAWSPDGKLVVVQGQREPLLVETGSGRVVRTLSTADVVWVSEDRLLYRRPSGSRDFVLADLTGRELVRQPLPHELVDREITVAPR